MPAALTLRDGGMPGSDGHAGVVTVGRYYYTRVGNEAFKIHVTHAYLGVPFMDCKPEPTEARYIQGRDTSSWSLGVRTNDRRELRDGVRSQCGA